MNNKKIITIIISIALTGVMEMISCTHSPYSQPVVAVSFSKDIIPIFTTYCTVNSSCHVGANSLNLQINLDSDSAYYVITSKNLVNTNNPPASLLYVEVEGNGIADMPKPPLPALSASQQNLILKWIQQGAKNN